MAQRSQTEMFHRIATHQATFANNTASATNLHHGNALFTPFAGWGMALLLTAAISWFNRRQKTVASTNAKLTASSISQMTQPEALEAFPFTQALQWVSYGKQLEKAQHYKAALTVYEKGLSYYPEDFRLWHERGLVLAKLQRFEEAIASYDQAHRIHPHHRDLAHERGDALLQLKHYQAAIDSFDVFLAYASHNVHVLADRGYALFQLQRYEEALQSLNQALSSPQRDQSSMLYARYYQIETLRQLGQLEAALHSAQKGMKQAGGETFQRQYLALQQQITNAKPKMY